jgi:hypothetical protein
MTNETTNGMKLMIMEFSFIPENSGELSAQVGEEVYLLDNEEEAKVSGWAQVLKKDGCDGFVPFAYLKAVKTDDVELAEYISIDKINESPPISPSNIAQNYLSSDSVKNPKNKIDEDKIHFSLFLQKIIQVNKLFPLKIFFQKIKKKN